MEKPLHILCNTTSYNYGEYPADLILVKNSHRRKMTEGELGELIHEYDPVGIIAGLENINSRHIEIAKNLKVISRCGIDLETIDQKSAKKHGIIVTGTHLAPDVPAAELTLGVILSLVRQIRILDEIVRSGKWERRVTGLLKGKMVGIIGCGILGTRVSSLLYAFECGLIGYDPAVKMHDFCEMVGLDFLLRNSDIVTLHMPLREENYHIIGSRQIEIMKNGAILVNTSRPGLVDEDALAAALDNGKLGGAALDVFENEPYDGPLIRFTGNTILTPHIGSHAGTYRFDIEKEAMDNLIEGLRRKGIDL